MGFIALKAYINSSWTRNFTTILRKIILTTDAYEEDLGKFLPRNIQAFLWKLMLNIFPTKDKKGLLFKGKKNNKKKLK